jgi:hypothetical protein
MFWGQNCDEGNKTDEDKKGEGVCVKWMNKKDDKKTKNNWIIIIFIIIGLLIFFIFIVPFFIHEYNLRL